MTKRNVVVLVVALVAMVAVVAISPATQQASWTNFDAAQQNAPPETGMVAINGAPVDMDELVVNATNAADGLQVDANTANFYDAGNTIDSAATTTSTAIYDYGATWAMALVANDAAMTGVTWANKTVNTGMAAALNWTDELTNNAVAVNTTGADIDAVGTNTATNVVAIYGMAGANSIELRT